LLILLILSENLVNPVNPVLKNLVNPDNPVRKILLILLILSKKILLILLILSKKILLILSWHEEYQQRRGDNYQSCNGIRVGVVAFQEDPALETSHQRQDEFPHVKA